MAISISDPRILVGVGDLDARASCPDAGHGDAERRRMTFKALRAPRTTPCRPARAATSTATSRIAGSGDFGAGTWSRTDLRRCWPTKGRTGVGTLRRSAGRRSRAAAAVQPGRVTGHGWRPGPVHITDQRLGLVRWTAWRRLMPMSTTPTRLGEDEEDGEPDEDLEGWDVPHPPGPERDRLSRALSGLGSSAGQPWRRRRPAGVVVVVVQWHTRCWRPCSTVAARPSPLRGESLKDASSPPANKAGSSSTRCWRPVCALRAHLKAAAEAGIARAALEYGTVFPSVRVRAWPSAWTVMSTPSRCPCGHEPRSLHPNGCAGVKAGSRGVGRPADLGIGAGAHGARANVHWLRDAAERALAEDDPLRAWTWQYVALARERTSPNPRWRPGNDGGSNDGEFYGQLRRATVRRWRRDLRCPELTRDQHREAKAKAQDPLRLVATTQRGRPATVKPAYLHDHRHPVSVVGVWWLGSLDSPGKRPELSVACTKALDLERT